MKERIGIQGSRGAFHEIAAIQLFGKKQQIVYIDTFEKLFSDLNSGLIDKAVVAIANIQVGFIDEPHKELIANSSKYWISGETYVAVAHQLLALPGTKLSQIKHIHSMAPAIQQCAHTLRHLLPNAELIEEADTALSAELVSKLKSPSHAAVASRRAGEINGLQVISANVQDRKKNITRFLVLEARSDQIENRSSETDKTTMLLETPNKKGSLFKALLIFWMNRINITTLHSSFVEDSDFNEKFYIEYDAGIWRKKSKLLIKLLTLLGNKVTISGSYTSENINLHTK